MEKDTKTILIVFDEIFSSNVQELGKLFSKDGYNVEFVEVRDFRIDIQYDCEAVVVMLHHPEMHDVIMEKLRNFCKLHQAGFFSVKDPWWDTTPYLHPYGCQVLENIFEVYEYIKKRSLKARKDRRNSV